MTLKEIYKLKSEVKTEDLIKRVGWIETTSAPEEIWQGTFSLVDGIRKQIMVRALEESHLWNCVDFRGQNMESIEYEKSFDRIVLTDGRQSFTIIGKMPSASKKYMVYKTGDAAALGGFKGRNQCIEYLVEKIDG